MKKLFSSLEYYEKLNKNLIIRRSKYGNFILLSKNKILMHDIKDYLVIEAENGKQYIFTKSNPSFTFSMFEIKEENIELIFYFEETTYFERNIEFYFDDFLVDSSLRIRKCNFEDVKFRITNKGYKCGENVKRYDSEDFTITSNVSLDVKLNGIKIKEFDLDPEFIELDTNLNKS